MRILTRLPIYAVGLALTVALVSVSVSREWPGWLTFAVAVVLVAFYVVTILVPLLMRQKWLEANTRGHENGGQTVAVWGNDLFLNLTWGPDSEIPEPTTTEGSLKHPRPQVTLHS